MKPYFVTLEVSAVVMAENRFDALIVAVLSAREICSDQELSCDSAEEVCSLEHLADFNSDWDGECIPYNGDGNTRLNTLLPETAPDPDTRTGNLFKEPIGGAV